jgi:hypothetical protein
MEYKLVDTWPWAARSKLPPERGVYAIMRGEEAIYFGQADSDGGVLARVQAFEKSATTGDKGNTGGQSFYRQLLTFDGLRVLVYDLLPSSTWNYADLKDHLHAEYVRGTNRKALCVARWPKSVRRL